MTGPSVFPKAKVRLTVCVIVRNSDRHFLSSVVDSAGSPILDPRDWAFDPYVCKAMFFQEDVACDYVYWLEEKGVSVRVVYFDGWIDRLEGDW